ncbi:MAG: translation initiation factor IF-2 subunit beta [Candidatus ainarchaeum sp.]|jgi:translation initiation factor 2 subunit 2|nr:translation initiation factor IF-2 subunit beta [Candidatus ainarchaeum sp.]
MVNNEKVKDNSLDYNSLLDRLYMSLPTKTLEDTRFELPTVDSIVQGKQTIWKNFSKCAKDLKREELQMYKFVMKEISTSSTIVNGTLVLNGIFNNQKMNQILEKYLKFFVLCSACKKPDTEIVVQNNVKILKCTACGAISPLPKL